MAELPRTYTADQMAEILQIPRNEVYRDAAGGIIPGRIAVGGRTRFNAYVVDMWLKGEEV